MQRALLHCNACGTVYVLTTGVSNGCRVYILSTPDGNMVSPIFYQGAYAEAVGYRAEGAGK